MKGFTLIEILIVVILLGILAAIVVPMFSATADEAKVTAQQADIQTLQSAVALYRAKESGFPATLGALVPGYIDELPTDPVSESAYTYNATTGIVSEGT